MTAALGRELGAPTLKRYPLVWPCRPDADGPNALHGQGAGRLQRRTQTSPVRLSPLNAPHRSWGW